MAHSVRHFFCPQHEGYWVSRLLSDGVFCADSVETLPVSNSNSKKTYELKTFINKYFVLE